MKKIFVVASLALLAACNSNETAKTDSMKSGADSSVQAINSPYPIAYSSNFEMDNPKNAETVLTLWKDWDNGNLSAHKDMLADSIEMYFTDGSMIYSSRDSITAASQNYRNTLASVTSSVDAVMALKSKDKDENWAVIWGKEINTDKKGKIDSFYLHETWRFNKDGKADLMFQYKRGAVPPKK